MDQGAVDVVDGDAESHNDDILDDDCSDLFPNEDS